MDPEKKELLEIDVERASDLLAEEIENFRGIVSNNLSAIGALEDLVSTVVILLASYNTRLEVLSTYIKELKETTDERREIDKWFIEEHTNGKPF